MQAIKIFQDNSVSLLNKEYAKDIIKEKRCVYVLSPDDYDLFLSSGLSIQEHANKNPDKSLKEYLLSNNKTHSRKIEAIFAPFTSKGRLFQAIKRLLNHAEEIDFPCFLVVGIPGTIYDQLLEQLGALPETGQDDVTSQGYEIQLSKNEKELLKTVQDKFCGLSRCAERVRMQIVEAVASEMPVMILGETGTGKEVVARLIHENSKLSGGNFIVVNCGAIPSLLVESELFGYEPFAFSGAGPQAKKGLWEVANGGTLFLDEIGDLPLDAQVKILRALENRVIRRVGGTKDIEANPRIIVATHRNLCRMVEQGTFREDLFYRLRIMVIRTPSLVENLKYLDQDICRFWENITDGKGPDLSRRVLEQIAKRSWVGNYRDLKNFLRALWEHWQRCNVKQLLPIHIRTIEERYGQSPKAPDELPAGKVDRAVQRMRYMQHHAMCAEVLRALQLAITPMTKREKTVPVDLETRLRHGAAELDLLLEKPQHFCDSSTFHAVDNACHATEDLLDIFLTNPAKASKIAKRTTLPKLNDGLDATFKGM